MASSGTMDIKTGWQEFACGWGAAFINITVTYPINKVMFRQVCSCIITSQTWTNLSRQNSFQMLHGLKTKTAVAQLRSEGAWYLYRGMLPPLVQKTLSVSLMFGMYEQYRQVLHSNAPSLPTPLTNGVAAMLAGTTEAILAPCERIQTLLQVIFWKRKQAITLIPFFAFFSRTRAIISSSKTQHTLSARFGHLTVDVSFTEALCQFFSGMALATFYSFGAETRSLYTGLLILQILLLPW